MADCNNCGSTIDNKADYCMNCGAPIKDQCPGVTVAGVGIGVCDNSFPDIETNIITGNERSVYTGFAGISQEKHRRVSDE